MKNKGIRETILNGTTLWYYDIYNIILISGIDKENEN